MFTPFSCHWYVWLELLLAATPRVTPVPAFAVLLAGCVVIDGRFPLETAATVWVTLGAALYAPFPGQLATTGTGLASRTVSVEPPVMVALPLWTAKLTGRPELEVAFKDTGPLIAILPIGEKVIVCELKTAETASAAAELVVVKPLASFTTTE